MSVYRTLRLSLFACLSLLLTACVTVPQGMSLNDPAPATHSVNQSIWLKQASIVDKKSRIKDAAVANDALTLSIGQYIAASHRFSASNTLPGKVKSGDHVLDFSFDTYRLRRKTHPAYFPAAILTATLYIWFNGPIFTDNEDISATLSVYDANNQLLTQFTEHKQGKNNVGFWSPNYVFPDGATARTAVVAGLLDQYADYLATHTVQSHGEKP